MKIKLLLGDCLDQMKKIETGTVGMIFCDLPYGKTPIEWDKHIPIHELWSEYKRVRKPNAAILFTAVQPFTSLLVMSNLKEFKYEWIWKKNLGSNMLNARFQPMRYHESILVFYKEQPNYNPQMTNRVSRASEAACSRPIKSGISKSHHTTSKLDNGYRSYESKSKGPESVLSINGVPNAGGKNCILLKNL
jgi:site-specific DNA-methyltransferase (adenine-specific)